MFGLLVLLAASRGHASSIRFEAFGPFSMRSTSEGQLSSDTHELHTHSTAELQVKYLAPVAHCSSIRMHFLLDGAERGVSEPVPPGGSSGYFDFGAVTAGEHVVGLRAEGIVGGCNGGRLIAWGGSAILRTSDDGDAGLDSRATALGAVVFYSMTVNYARGLDRHGVFVTESGEVHSFIYDRAELDWQPTPDRNGRIPLLDLQERFGHHARWLAKLDVTDLESCESALASIREVARRNSDPRYDAPTTSWGAYRLDSASGRYAAAPCTSEAH